MRLHRRGVDENLRGRSTCLRERVKEIDPNAFGRPANVTIVERLLRPIVRRRVNPAPTGFEHMNDVYSPEVSWIGFLLKTAGSAFQILQTYS